MSRNKRGRRIPPRRRANRKVTVSFTPGELETVSLAARQKGESVG